MKRILLISILVLAVVFAFTACSGGKASTTTSAASSGYVDGTYTGSAQGLNGEVPVTVTVKGGKITDIAVGENKETPAIAAAAIEKIPAAIIAAQSTKVDAVSGATITSNAIIKAVEQALSK